MPCRTSACWSSPIPTGAMCAGFDLATIRGVERKERGDGSGDLTLLLDGGRRTLRQSLAGIPEVARVGAEIDRLRRKAQETQPPPSVPPPAPPAEPDPSG